MLGRNSVRSRRALAGLNEPQPTIAEAAEQRERVKARLVHLIYRRRFEIERATRLLRIHFVNRRGSAPKRGMLHWLLLVGEYADTDRRDREDECFTESEIWAFVDHAAYKGLNRYWGIARRAVTREILGPAPLTLSVFTIDEPERFRAAGNRFLTSRYDNGIVLYDRAMDGPRDAKAEAVHARIALAAATLPPLPREALRLYRRRGLDYRLIALRLEISEAEAEMHLSDALGTLLAMLGEDALPRSLRPRLEEHPRHHLDLFHRPQDFDRILAVAFYRRAVAFAVHFADNGVPGSIVASGAAHVAEFALKSYLLRSGASDDWNRRHIGHDIEKALSCAVAKGLNKIPPEMERLASPLARYHMGGRTPALARDVEAAMPMPHIIAAVGKLLDVIGEATGYQGLPAEEDA